MNVLTECSSGYLFQTNRRYVCCVRGPSLRVAVSEGLFRALGFRFWNYGLRRGLRYFRGDRFFSLVCRMITEKAPLPLIPRQTEQVIMIQYCATLEVFAGMLVLFSIRIDNGSFVVYEHGV